MSNTPNFSEQNQSFSSATSQAKGSGTSRRRALKQALVAGAGVAMASVPTFATANDSNHQPEPQVTIPGNQKVVLPHTTATPGTNYKLFAGFDFRPFSSNISYGYSSVGVLCTNNVNTFLALLDLPQQAQITEVEFYYVRNAPSAGTTNTAFYLNECIPSIALDSLVSRQLVNTNSSAIRTVLLSFNTTPVKIDNTTSKYYLAWQPAAVTTGSESDILYGARVGYTGGLGRFGA